MQIHFTTELHKIIRWKSQPSFYTAPMEYHKIVTVPTTEELTTEKSTTRLKNITAQHWTPVFSYEAATPPSEATEMFYVERKERKQRHEHKEHNEHELHNDHEHDQHNEHEQHNQHEQHNKHGQHNEYEQHNEHEQHCEHEQPNEHEQHNENEQYNKHAQHNEHEQHNEYDQHYEHEQHNEQEQHNENAPLDELEYKDNEQNERQATVKTQRNIELSNTTFAAIIKEDTKDICPHFILSKHIFDLEPMTGVWQTAYFSLPSKIDCFKILIKRITEKVRT